MLFIRKGEREKEKGKRKKGTEQIQAIRLHSPPPPLKTGTYYKKLLLFLPFQNI